LLADGLGQNLNILLASGAKNMEAELNKLQRAPLFTDEFRGILREVVIARRFAEQRALVVFEPKGKSGPDLAIHIHGHIANIEVKRLTLQTNQIIEVAVDQWYQEEYLSPSNNQTFDYSLRRVDETIRSAYSQLIKGEPNIIVVQSYDPQIPAGTFRTCVTWLTEEIEANQTYGKLSAILFVTSWSSLLGEQRALLWQNPHAHHPLSQDLLNICQMTFNIVPQQIYPEIEKLFSNV
jgi:hypothetical protein